MRTHHVKAHDNTPRGSQSGQALVLVALLMIGLVAVLGLVLDGGNMYLHRRRMQNAADAGAIAGARVFCLGGTESEVWSVVHEYTVQRNQAQSFDLTLGGSAEDEASVEVVAHTDVPMTFTRVVGINQASVSAEAESMCGPAGAVGGLAPISIREHSYVIGEEYTIWDTEEEMDPAGGNLSGSNRGWLSLACVYPDDCTNGAQELKSWMHTGYPGIIEADDWVRPASGEMAAVIQQAFPGQRLLMPVFRVLRDYPNAGDKPFYHIVAFAAFDVSYVFATGSPKGIRGTFVRAVAAGPIGGAGGGLRAVRIVR